MNPVLAVDIGTQQDATDVADAEPRHRRPVRIEIREPEHHTPQSGQCVVGAPDEFDQRLARIAVQRSDRGVGGGRRFLAVSETVDDGDERPLADALDEAEIAGLGLPRQRQRRERRIDFQIARRHFFMVMVVPRPTTESTSNSSINRFAPGSPAPTPCEVE